MGPAVTQTLAVLALVLLSCSVAALIVAAGLQRRARRAAEKRWKDRRIHVTCERQK